MKVSVINPEINRSLSEKVTESSERLSGLPRAKQRCLSEAESRASCRDFQGFVSFIVGDKTLDYTQATSKCRIQLGLETPLGEALVEDNSYSIVKINNDG